MLDEHPYVSELHAFRKLYHAALFNAWTALELYGVHKSKRHHDGSLCFGGDMFIVVASLPTGLVSNHYFMGDWDLFSIEESDKALVPYDGHTPGDVLDRLQRFLSKKE